MPFGRRRTSEDTLYGHGFFLQSLARRGVVLRVRINAGKQVVMCKCAMLAWSLNNCQHTDKNSTSVCVQWPWLTCVVSLSNELIAYVPSILLFLRPLSLHIYVCVCVFGYLIVAVYLCATAVTVPQNSCANKAPTHTHIGPLGDTAESIRLIRPKSPDI